MAEYVQHSLFEQVSSTGNAIVSGVALSPTLVFEQPTPRAIAAHLLDQLVGAATANISGPAGALAGSRAAVERTRATLARCEYAH